MQTGGSPSDAAPAPPTRSACVDGATVDASRARRKSSKPSARAIRVLFHDRAPLLLAQLALQASCDVPEVHTLAEGEEGPVPAQALAR